MSLGTEVRDLAETLTALDLAVEGEEFDTLDEALISYALIQEAATTLSRIREELAKKLADEMPDKRVVVEGVGTFEKHGKRDCKKWDRESLLRDVLDTRQFDEDGTDASPLEKVTRVWNLGAPRVTVLREMGLDPEDYCESEFAGFTIQLLAS